MQTVVPHYFALEDLKEDWANLRDTSASAVHHTSSTVSADSASGGAKGKVVGKGLLSVTPKPTVPKIPLEPNVRYRAHE